MAMKADPLDDPVFANLPKNITDCNRAETRAIIEFYAKKPLKELRKRQALCASQIKEAQGIGARKEEAIANLQRTTDCLMFAVMLREFNDADARASTDAFLSNIPEKI